MFLKKISKETVGSNEEFMLKCGISDEKQFEHLNKNSWFIQNKQYETVESDYSKSDRITSKNNKFDDKPVIYSNILAYNNNTLDKIILAHAYQQKCCEVFKS